MRDIAEVKDSTEDFRSFTRINGKPAISIMAFKAQDANIVEVGTNLKRAAENVRKQLPPGVELRLLRATSDFVERSANNVKVTIIEGGLLTVLIVFLFLGSWRSTVITGLALPISVIATFVALYAFGFTLNYMTLMALSLCIGLLIDDAIVVRENIVRHLAMGKTHRQASLEATQEIGLAVMATTFTIVAVFIPVAFMGGIVGKFFFQFGVTVTVAVLVSLFVSFTLDPMLSSVWRDPPARWLTHGPIGWVLGRLDAREDRGLEARTPVVAVADALVQPQRDAARGLGIGRLDLVDIHAVEDRLGDGALVVGGGDPDHLAGVDRHLGELFGEAAGGVDLQQAETATAPRRPFQAERVGAVRRVVADARGRCRVQQLDEQGA